MFYCLFYLIETDRYIHLSIKRKKEKLQDDASRYLIEIDLWILDQILPSNRPTTMLTEHLTFKDWLITLRA